MVLIVQRYEVTRTEKGYSLQVMTNFRLKFQNDNPPVENPLDAGEWRTFLESYRDPATGKRLKRTSAVGNPIAYRVCYWGAPPGVAKALNRNKGGYINVFPGYNNQTNKPLAIGNHGRLRG